MSVTRQRIGSLLGLVIGLGGVAFVVIRVARDRDKFSDAIASADVGWLIVATLCGIAAVAGIGWNWLALLVRRAVRFRRRTGFGWFFLGQLGKYVPGGIWPVVGQAELARRGGADRGDAYAATATSMVATLLGAVALAVVTGLLSPYDRWFIASLLALALVVGLFLFSLPAVRIGIHRVVDSVLKRELRLPATGLIVVQTVRHIPVWIAFSAMNVFVVAALDSSPGARLISDIAFVTCLSWMAGFVIVGLPGGIGVREAVFVSLMTAPLGATLAVSVAVASRLVSIVVDLVVAAASLPFARHDTRCDTLRPAECES